MMFCKWNKWTFQVTLVKPQIYFFPNSKYVSVLYSWWMAKTLQNSLCMNLRKEWCKVSYFYSSDHLNFRGNLNGDLHGRHFSSWKTLELWEDILSLVLIYLKDIFELRFWLVEDKYTHIYNIKKLNISFRFIAEVIVLF